MAAPINGTNGNDFLEGDRDDNDHPNTTPAEDTINGIGGNDVLIGWQDADQLSGGIGDDQLEGGQGGDVLDGGDGSDQVILFDDVTHTINLQTGTGTGGEADGDTYISIENAQLGEAADVVVGSTADNVILAFGGNDTVSGFDGKDNLSGWAGNDSLDGGEGDDTVDGGDGNDTLIGGAGNDFFYAGDGADSVSGGAGADDYLIYSFSVTGTGVAVNLATGKGTAGDAAGDRYSGIEDVQGASDYSNALIGDNAGNYMVGGNVADTIHGGDGDDRLYGLGGADVLDGGNDIDLVYYYNSAAAVTVDLNTGKGTGGDAQGDTLTGIENLYGSNTGGDTLLGGTADNKMWGAGGDDSINGGEGGDSLDGGAGDDRVFGGKGDDTIVAGMGADTINGNDGNDTLDYSQTANFTGTLAAITADLRIGKITDPSGAIDDVQSVEHIIGTGLADAFYGIQPESPIVFDGGAGSDTFQASTAALLYDPIVLLDAFNGGDGNDRFFLGSGRVDADGGKGTDTVDASGYTFATAPAGNDSDPGLVIRLDTGRITKNSDANNFDFNEGSDLLGRVKNVEVIDCTERADVILGGDGKTTIYGNEGRDLLDGGAGNDIVNGGESTSDVFFDSAGNDVYHDPDGGEVRFEHSTHAVTVDMAARTATGNGSDRWDATIHDVAGSNFADTFTTSDATDTILTLAGNDLIEVGAGQDLSDFFWGLEGDFDTVSYAARHDGLYFDEHAVADIDGKYNSTQIRVTTFDHTHWDTLREISHIVGGAFDDEFNQVEWDLEHLKNPTLYPTATPGFLVLDASYEGGAGDDTFSGIYGRDTIDGGSGVDSFVPGNLAGDVTIDLDKGLAKRDVWQAKLISIEDAYGNDGDDTLVGSRVANDLGGGDGNDTISGGLRDDTMDGEKGTDTLTFAASLTAVAVDLVAGSAKGEGNDTIKNFENVIGSDFDDTLKGSAVKNALLGGVGNDMLAGLGGNDTLNGGQGSDTGDFSTAKAAMTIDLGAGSATGEGTDKLIGIENAIGSKFADTITGSSSKNELFGGAGNDTIDGLTGLDHLTGGKGDDIFIISKRDAIDVIEDFKPADDTLKVDHSALPGTATIGAVTANHFVAGLDPVAKGPTCFVYHTDTGVLAYDADGPNGIAEVQVAVFANAPTLTFHDIFVI